MKLTIGIPCYKAYSEVWMTIQALRMFHDLTNTEILIIDNAGDAALERFSSRIGVRYVRETSKQGPAVAKNAVLREAKGEWTLCMDSHVLLSPNALNFLRGWISTNPNSIDLLHGPLLGDNGDVIADAMNPEWGTDKKFGTWRGATVHPYAQPYEIPMHGCGLFACRTAVWPGFPADWEGFANEEGYIHERFRRFGGKIILLPGLRWMHLFRDGDTPGPYAPLTKHLKRNFYIAYRDLQWDPAPITERYGPEDTP